MNRFVVYTVMTGGYEQVSQPECIDPRFDYVLFSNDFKDNTNGVWQIRHIDCKLDGDNKRLSRYPKTHPESLLSEYEASLYIDANLSIADNWIYDRFIELFKKGCIYSGIKLLMSGRDCIFEHAFDMSIAGVVHDYDAIVQCHELYKRGFPRHFGLNENNVIFRRHTKEMEEVDKEWWWWITNYTFRDQLSYMYCLWHHNIPISEYFLPEGEDTHNSKRFNFVSHNKTAAVQSKKWVKRGLIEKLRNQSWNYNRNKYSEQWFNVCKSKWPKFVLRIWGIFTILCNIHNFVKSLFTQTSVVIERLKQ